MVSRRIWLDKRNARQEVVGGQYPASAIRGLCARARSKAGVLKCLPMEVQQQPIHWDQHRSSFNFTLIFALVVAVIGIMGNYPLLAIGLGVAAYTWLTTPRQYLVYRDALVIKYGTPRVKPIPFANISHLETLSLPMGERLRVRMVDGKRTFLTAKDPDTFRQHLEQALGSYHDSQGGGDWVESRGTLVADRPLNTTGTVFSTDESELIDASEATDYSASSDEAPPFDEERGYEERGGQERGDEERAPEPSDDPRGPVTDLRGPVTPFDSPTTPEEERKSPY